MGHGRGEADWMARYQDQSYGPTNLTDAKDRAKALANGEPGDKPIDLNRTYAFALDRKAWKRLRSGWPIELMGGQKRPDGFRRLELDGGLNSKGQERYVQAVEVPCA